MTTTNTFVGIAESQRVSSRVLKPPGGGSSISFGDDEVSQVIKPKVAQQQQQPQEAPKNGTHEEPAANAETNGTKTPKDNATATKENNPSAATNGIANNGTMSNGSNGTPNSGSSTPNSSRLDTQTRLFGEETRHHHEVANRRVRDHQRSNIFSGDGEKLNTPKSANPTGNETPEAKTPEQPQTPQSQQKQRIPPGGFSTKLW